MISIRTLSIRTLLLSFALQGAVHAQGIAMALDRTGAVEVIAGGKTTPLAVLDYMPPDAELRLPAGASATLVYLQTSREWQFAGPGRYRLQAGQPAVLQGAAPKARGVPAASSQAMAKLEPAQRERMALGAVVMRASSPLRIVGPNNVDVLDTRPTLLWLVTEGRPVRVTVSPAGSASPAAQTVTSAMQWKVPADLPPGDYVWRTEIATDESVTPAGGKFHLIELTDERRKRIDSQVPAGFAPRVARAVMLESEDLPHDALLLWRGLAAERPDEPSITRWAK